MLHTPWVRILALVIPMLFVLWLLKGLNDDGPIVESTVFVTKIDVVQRSGDGSGRNKHNRRDYYQIYFDDWFSYGMRFDRAKGVLLDVKKGDKCKIVHYKYKRQIISYEKQTCTVR